MPHIALQHIYGAGLRDHREVAVSAEAQQWFNARVGARLPVGAENRTAQNIFPLIVTAFAELLSELLAKVGGNKESAIAIVQKAYMDYVAPLDIKAIPDIIEPTVDRAIAYLLGVIVGVVIDKLPHPPTPTPGPNGPVTPVGSANPS